MGVGSSQPSPVGIHPLARLTSMNQEKQDKILVFFLVMVAIIIAPIAVLLFQFPIYCLAGMTGCILLYILALVTFGKRSALEMGIMVLLVSIIYTQVVIGIIM